MKNKGIKMNIIIGMTSFLLVTLILLGLTYAYYRTRIVGNTNEKSVSVESKKYEVKYTDGSATLSTTGLIEPGFTYTKEFTVTNTGSESVRYSVMFDNVENTFTRLEDWTYTISESGTELKSDTLPNSDNYILYSESIDAGATKSYTLVINYAYLEDVNQSDDMGASLSFRINISDSLGTTLINATEGTLLYAINRDNVVSVPLTAPGQAATLETEAILAPTEDDYGTSYYYRGNVVNNYVNYSGMCWRIVRVQGDGNIKLTLADENGECNASTYSTDNTKSAFIDGRTDIAYKSSVEKNVNDFLFEDSDVLEVLNTWLTSKNLDTSKLVEAEWCNDTAKTGSSEDFSFYGAYSRLISTSTANPTLKCMTNGIAGTTGLEKQSTKYLGKIAFLTADEVAFAGATSNFSSSNKYYLQTNANGNWYWTFSPSRIGEKYGSYVWQITSIGCLLWSNNTLSSKGAVRPSIVLKSSVLINEDDNGTLENPYVIS